MKNTISSNRVYRVNENIVQMSLDHFNELMNRLRTLESKYNKLESDYDELESKYDELELKYSESLAMISGYKAKIKELEDKLRGPTGPTR